MSVIKVFVGNVAPTARIAELSDLFEKFGKVVDCYILNAPTKDFAFVHMTEMSEAKAAVAGLNDIVWKGYRLRVEMSYATTGKIEPPVHRLVITEERSKRRGYNYERRREQYNDSCRHRGSYQRSSERTSSYRPSYESRRLATSSSSHRARNLRDSSRRRSSSRERSPLRSNGSSGRSDRYDRGGDVRSRSYRDSSRRRDNSPYISHLSNSSDHHDSYATSSQSRCDDHNRPRYHN